MSEKGELKLISHNVEWKREVGESKKENITYIADVHIVSQIQICTHLK